MKISLLLLAFVAGSFAANIDDTKSRKAAEDQAERHQELKDFLIEDDDNDEEADFDEEVEESDEQSTLLKSLPFLQGRAGVCAGMAKGSCNKQGGTCVTEPFTDNCKALHGDIAKLKKQACKSKDCQCCIPPPTCDGKIKKSCSKNGGSCVLKPFKANCKGGTLDKKACKGKYCQCCTPGATGGNEDTTPKPATTAEKTQPPQTTARPTTALPPVQTTTPPPAQTTTPPPPPPTTTQPPPPTTLPNEPPPTTTLPPAQITTPPPPPPTTTQPPPPTTLPNEPPLTTTLPPPPTTTPPPPPPTTTQPPPPTTLPNEPPTTPPQTTTPQPPPTTTPPPPPTTTLPPPPTTTPPPPPTTTPPPPPTTTPPPPPTTTPPPPPTTTPPPPPTTTPPPPPTTTPPPPPTTTPPPPPTTIPPPTPTSQGLGCTGGVLIKGQCLTISTEELSWDDAKERCSSQNGALASLDDPQAFRDYFNTNYDGVRFWLGGSDKANEGNWVWQNGRPFGDQFPWGSNEPNNYGGNEHCVVAGHGGNYNDDVCSKKFRFVCNQGCTSGVLIKGQCLTVSTEELSWDDAKQRCTSQNGVLASLDDPQAFHDYVNRNYDGERFWLGGSDGASEGNWVWQNGRPFDQFPWGSNEPNNWGGNQHCLLAGHNGNYDDGTCSDKFGFVCNQGCTSGELIKGQCMTISTEELSWDDAKQMCSSQNGALASLDDPQAFHDYINRNYDGKKFWLGGTDSANEGNWVWQNGQPFGDQFPWGSGEPNNWGGNQNCLVAGHGGNYDDGTCSNKFGFVCN